MRSATPFNTLVTVIVIIAVAIGGFVAAAFQLCQYYGLISPARAQPYLEYCGVQSAAMACGYVGMAHYMLKIRKRLKKLGPSYGERLIKPQTTDV